MFFYHVTSPTCAQWASLEPVEKVVPQSAVTGAKPKIDYLLLSTKLVASVILSGGQCVILPVCS